MSISSYEKSRFISDIIPQELICKYCDEVLNDPVQCFKCKYFFCYTCSKAIYESREFKCKHETSQINKLIKKKVDDLVIKCRFYKNGCAYSNKVSIIEKHELNCHFGVGNPNNPQYFKVVRPVTPMKKENMILKYSPKATTDVSPLRVNNNLSNTKKCDKCGYQGAVQGIATKENTNSQAHNCIEYLKSMNDNKQGKIKELEDRIEQLKNEKVELKREYEDYKSTASKKIDYFSCKVQELKAEIKSLNIENESLKNSIKPIDKSDNQNLQNLKQMKDNLEDKLHSYIEKKEHDFNNFTKNIGNEFFEFLENSKKNYLDYQVQACHELINDIIHERALKESISSINHDHNLSICSQNSVIIKQDADIDYSQFKGIIFNNHDHSFRDLDSSNLDNQYSIRYSSRSSLKNISLDYDDEIDDRQSTASNNISYDNEILSKTKTMIMNGDKKTKQNVKIDNNNTNGVNFNFKKKIV